MNEREHNAAVESLKRALGDRTPLPARYAVDALVGEGWAPPRTATGKVHGQERFDDYCPTCGNGIFEHVLVAGPPGEPDFYECIETHLRRQAAQGDEVAGAAVHHIDGLRAAAGL